MYENMAFELQRKIQKFQAMPTFVDTLQEDINNLDREIH